MIEALEADRITPTQRALHQQFIATRRRIFEARIKSPPPPEPEPEPQPASPPPELPPPKFTGSNTPPEFRAHHLPLNLTRIIKYKVAKKFGVHVQELESGIRSDWATLPRHIAVYLCSVVGQLPSPAIGRAFGYRDHTTILYAIHKIPRRMAASPMLTMIVNELQRELESEISAWRAA